MPPPNEAGDSMPAELAAIHRRLDAGDERMTRIEASICENAAASKANADSTAELVELLNTWKGAFKAFDYIGRLAKPLGAIVGLGAAIVGLWAAMKNGGPLR